MIFFFNVWHFSSSSPMYFGLIIYMFKRTALVVVVLCKFPSIISITITALDNLVSYPNQKKKKAIHKWARPSRKPGISHHSASKFSHILFVYILMSLHLESMNLYISLLIQLLCKGNTWTFPCTLVDWQTPPYLNFQSASPYPSIFQGIWYLKFLSVSRDLQHQSPCILLDSASCGLRLWFYDLLRELLLLCSLLGFQNFYEISPPILFDFPSFMPFQLFYYNIGRPSGWSRAKHIFILIPKIPGVNLQKICFPAICISQRLCL